MDTTNALENADVASSQEAKVDDVMENENEIEQHVEVSAQEAIIVGTERLHNVWFRTIFAVNGKNPLNKGLQHSPNLCPTKKESM